MINYYDTKNINEFIERMDISTETFMKFSTIELTLRCLGINIEDMDGLGAKNVPDAIKNLTNKGFYGVIKFSIPEKSNLSRQSLETVLDYVDDDIINTFNSHNGLINYFKIYHKRILSLFLFDKIDITPIAQSMFEKASAEVIGNTRFLCRTRNETYTDEDFLLNYKAMSITLKNLYDKL